jgi:hypothetical protein
MAPSVRSNSNVLPSPRSPVKMMVIQIHPEATSWGRMMDRSSP